MKKYSWESYSDEELLSMRLCDLKLILKGSQAEKHLHKLHRELAQKGLNFKPHAWIGDDWYSPDGIPGLSIPFFTIHPRLAQLEKKMMGFIEGGNPEHFMKLMRHEAGHAIDNAFRLRKSKRRQELFGLSGLPYPDQYEPMPYSKSFVRHIEGHYAQAHPDEDWAETFAVWLTPRSNWRQRYKEWGAIKKLNFLNHMMKEIKGKRPLVRNKDIMTPISESRMTLRTYYRRKRVRLKVEKPFFPRHLRNLFSAEQSYQKNPKALTLIRNEKRDICQKVAKETRQRHYRINKMLNDLARECRKRKLRLKTSKRLAKKELLSLLPKQTNYYLRDGRHRIIM